MAARWSRPSSSVFSLATSAPSGGLFSQAMHATAIPVHPSITISDVSVEEPGSPSASVPARFTVRLDTPSILPVTVQYATAAGTATAISDYAPVQNTLTIPAGATTGTITVNVRHDAIDELTETFFVNLGNATNALIKDAQGKGMILDNPPPLPPCPPYIEECQEK